MTFTIVSGKPRIRRCRHPISDSLGGALQEAFEFESEDLTISWNDVAIPLEYKYDIAIIVDDLLEMLQQLLDLRGGELEVSFGSDTFNCVWHIRWGGGTVNIRPTWLGLRASVPQVEGLRRPVELGTIEFLKQWEPVLRDMVLAVRESGVVIDNAEEIERLRELERVANGLAGL